MSTRPDRLRQAMRDHGSRQIDIVNALGVSKSTVSHWLSNPDAIPSGDTLTRLCAYLGMDINWYLHGKTKPTLAAENPDPVTLALDTARLTRVLVDLDQEFPPWRQKDPAVIARLINSFYGVDDDGPTATAREPATGRDSTR